ncbi:hypothetical protein ATDW_11670 [Asticcacaulis sp. DW145]|jgi:poly(3-hydroxybutyrate) depolymerase|uniref:hypothetical protein n=1 Tax=unclassified Asticcacaulis TaxID=2628350 RepID=UPI00308F733C|nr:hypothetical protein ATDW_11670 [Asticcacaulis sp. DW145]
MRQIITDTVTALDLASDHNFLTGRSGGAAESYALTLQPRMVWGAIATAPAFWLTRQVLTGSMSG